MKEDTQRPLYSYFWRKGNAIHTKLVDGSVKRLEKNFYSPTLYMPIDSPSEFKDIKHKYVKPVQFETMYDANRAIREGEGICAMPYFEYTHINEEFGSMSEVGMDHLVVANVDIEVYGEHRGCFPSASKAEFPVSAITVKSGGKRYILGLKDFDASGFPDTEYHKCKNERELLSFFVKLWVNLDVDIVTGWNVDGFDIPYLINRARRMGMESEMSALSPWKAIEEREVTIFGSTEIRYVIRGVSILDYLDLYKTFTFKVRETYKLDYIGWVELKTPKLDYSEYSSLDDLYDNNHQKYIEYNIRDVDIVDGLEEKLSLISLVVEMAYMTGVNFNDTFMPSKMWDVHIANYLRNERNIIVPAKSNRRTADGVVGGYVKEPIPAIYGWMVTVDVKSMYPSWMMTLNISPETFEDVVPGIRMEDILDMRSETIALMKESSEDGDYAVACNGARFRKDIPGAIPTLVDRIFKDRFSAKNEMKRIRGLDPRPEHKKQLSMLNTKQMALKILMNSCYGVLAQSSFRLFSHPMAEAITVSSRTTIRLSEIRLNEYINNVFSWKRDHCVAIDTDSLMFDLSPIVNYMGLTDKQEIVDALSKIAKDRFAGVLESAVKELTDVCSVMENRIEFERDAIADRGVFVAKKKYILQVLDSEGTRLPSPELKIMGIEAVRSSTPEVCRDRIKEALVIIMNKDNETLIDFIGSFKKEFLTLPADSIAFPRGVNEISKYQNPSDKMPAKGCPIHVKGSIHHNLLLHKHEVQGKYREISPGDKIKYIYLKPLNPIGNNTIAFSDILPPEFGLDRFIDRETQFEKAFVKPIQNIISVIGWHSEKIATTDDLFDQHEEDLR